MSHVRFLVSILSCSYVRCYGRTKGAEGKEHGVFLYYFLQISVTLHFKMKCKVRKRKYNLRWGYLQSDWNAVVHKGDRELCGLTERCEHTGFRRKQGPSQNPEFSYQILCNIAHA